MALAALGVAASTAQGAAAALSWCGGDETASDRLPDSVASWQFHVVYAYPADTPDRFLAVAGPIATDVDAVDRWWRREDPTRTVRLDRHAFSGCASESAALDLSVVRLPNPGEYYRPIDTRLDRVESDVRAAGTLATDSKKYLVYYDGPVGAEGVCGQGRTGFPDSGPTYALVYVRRDRCGTLGRVDYMAEVAAHELIYTLGVLPFPFPTPGPPHPCSDLAHVCDSGRDIMFPGGYCCLFDMRLDVGRDDYYGHGQSWRDLRDSKWLRHLDAPQFPLTVTLAGVAEEARVSTNPGGLDCPAACSAQWDSGSTVELFATGAGDSEFARWSGDCVGTDPICRVTITRATSVSAVYAKPRTVLAVTIRGRGAVRVAPGGRTCSRRCSASFASGTVVRLRASAAAGSGFVGWGGLCHGTRPCVLRLEGDRAPVSARFRRRG